MTTAPDLLTIISTVSYHSFVFDAGRYLIASGGVATIVWLLMRTRLRTRKIQTRQATSADIRRELVQSLRSCIVYVGITVSILWLINNGYIERIGPSLGWATDLALLGGIIIAHDAYFYWAHRTMHHPLLFKHFHRAHHRSITPTPFAAYSFSVPEAVVMGLFVVVWQFFFPTPGWVVFTFLAFQIIRNAMGHAGFELMPRWWLSTRVTSWINTTTHHDLHHAGSFSHNYGLYFTWWDKAMGTEHPRYHARFAEVVAVAEPQLAGEGKAQPAT